MALKQRIIEGHNENRVFYYINGFAALQELPCLCFYERNVISLANVNVLSLSVC
jgi:hypothetical protein